MLLSIKNYCSLLHLMILLAILGNSYAKELDDLIKSQDLIVKKYLPEVEELIFNANQNKAKAQFIYLLLRSLTK